MFKQGSLDRREFVKCSTAAGVAALSGGVWSSAAAAESKSPNEKLNVGSIGQKLCPRPSRS